METEYDFVSALLRIGEGGIDFFASCLLYLDPDELKMCRLVNRARDKFIRKEVWGNKGKRLLLKEKLLQRWKNVDPAAEEFGPLRMMVDPDLVNQRGGFDILQQLPCLLRASMWKGGRVQFDYRQLGAGLGARGSR